MSQFGILSHDVAKYMMAVKEEILCKRGTPRPSFVYRRWSTDAEICVAAASGEDRPVGLSRVVRRSGAEDDHQHVTQYIR